MRRELLDSKSGVLNFINRLKAVTPAFMEPAQLALRNPMPYDATLARASAQPPLHAPVSGSGGQLPMELPGDVMNQSSISKHPPGCGMSHGPSGPHQYEAMALHSSISNVHRQHSASPHSSSLRDGSGFGPVWNCPGAAPGLPAPPPGFALVPIAPDGSLHYPGAITSPHPGGMGLLQGMGGGVPWQQPPYWMHNQQGPALSQPQPAAQFFSHDQQQKQLTQQPQQQQKALLESDQNLRKRKHPDTGFPTNRVEGSVSGGSGHSGGGSGAKTSLASNANAAAQLRNRLKAATPANPTTPATTATSATPATTAAYSSLQEPRAILRQPQAGNPIAQQAQHGNSEPERAVPKPAGGVRTVDPAEVQIPEEECGLQAVHAAELSGDPDQDPYQGAHGPDCIRADDKTQVSPQATRCVVLVGWPKLVKFFFFLFFLLHISVTVSICPDKI